MKQRIISAIVGISFLVVVLCFYQTVVLTAAVALFCAIGVYEIFHATGFFSQHKVFWVVSELFAVAFPFLNVQGWFDIRGPLIVLFLLFSFCVLLKNHASIRAERLAFVCSATIGMCYAFSILVYVRDRLTFDSLYVIFLIFVIAWICDAGAYFFGRAFGKHKLAPHISPNKTVEGAVGGVVVNLFFSILLTLIFTTWVYPGVQAHYVELIAITIVGSLIAILGDLLASVVKRQYEIKDFGRLIPGHGGVIDRFDSWMLVAAAVYPMVVYFPILT